VHFSGSSEDDVIQPTSTSVWITYDCVSKKGNLGTHWKSPAGELELAVMEMTYEPNIPGHNMWKLQVEDVTAFQRSLEDDEEQLNIFNEAIGKFFQTPHVHIDISCLQVVYKEP
jgi:hypothetical protein